MVPNEWPSSCSEISGPCGEPPEVVAFVPPIPPYVNVLKIARLWMFCDVRGMPSTGATYVSMMRLWAWLPVSHGSTPGG
jgi:hypothetical protein